MPILSIHINTEIPLQFLLLLDKSVYLWSGSWFKRPSCTKVNIKMHEVHFLSLILQCSQKILSCRNRWKCAHGQQEQTDCLLLKWFGFFLQIQKCLKRDYTEISTQKETNPPPMILRTAGGFYQLVPSGQQSRFVTSVVFRHSQGNRNATGWQIVISIDTDKQISAKMLFIAYQMCWALSYGTRNEKLSTSHLCFFSNHWCTSWGV